MITALYETRRGHAPTLFSVLAFALLAACGQAASSPQEGEARSAALAVAKATCSPSGGEEQAARAAVEACLHILAERGETAEAGPIGAEPAEQLLGGLARLVHPDGRLRRFGTGESYEGLRAIDAAARAGFAAEVYELARQWQVDRRRADSDEAQNAVHAADALFEVASRNGNAAASLEVARKHIYWGVRYGQTNAYAESQAEFDAARRALASARTQEGGRLAQQAEHLLGELH